ncbi:nicotinamide riboside transporter PnuC [Lactobacillus sp. ESL0791]|uniref:nicotinamide riboside transporter PnuC n=1 Tax=Lactobacillus sp. ESL0791 TaxID=2983234 RepID=UPI0023F98C42|nr:nicotinamide riboside transporter PnuC [Lactobacillus sp. ESL0791]MDF7638608.1 nicotinamide riboside transporter PnuC [Lactobacillus sp. ESL0791]
MEKVSRAQIMGKGLAKVFNPVELFGAIFKMGWKRVCYLGLLLAIQIGSFFLMFDHGSVSLHPDTSAIGWIGLVAGITSILSVVIVANGDVTNYFWGILNNISYIYVSMVSHLYGEVYLNLYFFILQFIGIYQWTAQSLRANKEKDDDEIVTVKELHFKGWLLLTVLVALGWVVFGIFLKHVPFMSSVLDPHPWIDSLSVVVQVFAQALMVMRYGASQWLLWIIANCTELLLWTLNFNPIMLALWIANLINSLYGYYTWTKKLPKEE